MRTPQSSLWLNNPVMVEDYSLHIINVHSTRYVLLILKCIPRVKKRVNCIYCRHENEEEDRDAQNVTINISHSCVEYEKWLH